MARINRVQILLELDLEDLEAMSRRDLATNVSILASAGNKRIKRLKNSGLYSPALEYVEKHGGKFSVKGKNKNQLIIEYNRIADFMNSQTSTVSGVKKWQKNVSKAVFQKIEPQPNQKKTQTEKEFKKEKKQWDEEQKDFIKRFLRTEKTFWKVFQRLSDEYDVREKYIEAWEIIDEVMLNNSENSSVDDIYNMVKNKWETNIQTQTEDVSDLDL